MALTIGTDAYDSVDNIVAYWSDRGNTAWAALTTEQAEIYIRQATDWVDRTFAFTGEQASGMQRLKWPRKYVYLNSHAVEDTTIPWQLKEAVAVTADLFRLGTFDMDGIVTNDAAVTMEKVDVITVTYDAQSKLRGGVIPSNVYQLLRPLTGASSGGLLRA